MTILNTIDDKAGALLNFPPSFLPTMVPLSPFFSSFIPLCAFKLSSGHAQRKEKTEEKKVK